LPLEPQSPAAIAPSGAPSQKRRFEIPAEARLDDAASEPQQPAQNIGDQAPPATPEAKPEKPEGEKPEGDKPEGDKEEVTPEQAAKREGRRFERRLDKAYRRAAEAQARAELAEKRAAELEARTQTQARPPEGRPRLEDFEYDPEKYAVAVADFEKKEALKAHEAKQREETAKQARQKIVSVWEEQSELGADEFEDFNEVVGTIEPTNPMSVAIIEAGYKVAYHLGKNPKEAERIAGLSHISQVREIGKLEAKLAAKPEKPQTPSKAPAPITPLAASSTPASDVPSEDDDIKDWMKKRSKQVHGSGRR